MNMSKHWGPRPKRLGSILQKWQLLEAEKQVVLRNFKLADASRFNCGAFMQGTFFSSWTWYSAKVRSNFDAFGYRKILKVIEEDKEHLGVQPKGGITVFGAKAFSRSVTIVTIYDILGEEGLLHSMNEAEIEAAFTKADLLRTMNRVFCKCPTLKRIIYDGEIDLKDLKALHETHPDIETITLEELKQMGIDHPVEVVPPDSFRAHQTPKEVW
ncbi:hypothetical protein EDD21DRAFT_442698 [Dissophora ornata]|nr:hypothetical protein EDD21DRAFT_442698 [Dissophora ornata]